MARTKKEYQAPKSLTGFDGDGTEIVTLSHKLRAAEKDENGKETKPAVTDTIKVRVPMMGKMAGAGIKAFQKAINDAGGNGNDVLAHSLRLNILDQAKAARKEAYEAGKDLPDVSSLAPDFPAIRLTDENEATANQVLEKLRSGELSNEDIAALFGKLAKK